MKKRWLWIAILVLALLLGETYGLVLGPVAAARGPMSTTAPEGLQQADQSHIIQLPLFLHNYIGYSCSETPALVAPANGAVLNTITPLFQWDSGHPANANSVLMFVARVPDFSSLARSMASSDTEEEGSFRYPNNFEPGVTYYWRMRFRCQNNTSGPWTETWSFTTGSHGEILSAPQLVAPANDSVTSGQRVELSWNPVPGAVRYIAHWHKVGQSGCMYSWTSQTSVSPFGLQPGTTYEWWAAAINDYAIGESSPRWQFTTPPE